jgi:hypothetical protein
MLAEVAACFVACASFDDAPGTAPDAGGDGPLSSADGGSDDGPSTPTDASDAGTRSARYRAAVLGNGPLVYWRMGRIESAIIVPSEVSANPLVLGGGSDFQIGVPGIFDDDPAIRFGGQAGHAVAGFSEALAFDGSSPFTIECWARRELDDAGDAGSYFQHLVSYVDGFTTPGPSTQNGYLLYLRVDSPPATYAGYGAVDGGAVERSGRLVAPGDWAQYAMVFDGNSLQLFIDADPGTAAGVKGVLEPRVPATKFTIARASNEALRHFQGAIDEVAIYPTALSPAVLAEHIAIVRGP